jgi:hypothetical protein
MKRALILLFIAASVLSSCKREVYETPIPGTPVFSISGLRNGEPFTLSAGDNGLLQTSTLERNKFGVMEWRSSFVNANCNGCKPEFSIVLNDAQGVGYSDCANLGLFQNSSLYFADADSTSEFTSGTFYLSAENEDITAPQYLINGSASVNGENFEFSAHDIQTIQVQYSILDDIGNDINAISVEQSLYSGANVPLSSPFIYELTSGEDEQEDYLRIKFPPTDPDLRPTHWVIDGETSNDEIVDVEFSSESAHRIELHYINDSMGIIGYYSLEFSNAFPVSDFSNNDHHDLFAPHIHMDWATPTPNYEEAVITYTFGGKTYTSITPLNTTSNNRFNFGNYESFSPGISGNSAIKLNASFNVTLIEEEHPENVIQLTNCKASFGFIIPE